MGHLARLETLSATSNLLAAFPDKMKSMACLRVLSLQVPPLPSEFGTYKTVKTRYKTVKTRYKTVKTRCKTVKTRCPCRATVARIRKGGGAYSSDWMMWASVAAALLTSAAASLFFALCPGVQGYLTCKKMPSPRNLQ